MTDHASTILLVDPDSHTRALIAAQLSTLGVTILQADDAEQAMDVLDERDIRVVLTELYLATGDDTDLIHAIRRRKPFRKTRTVAHTHRSLAADRDWAMRAGADAYLIKPTRAERLRYVVGRLVTPRGANSVPVTSRAPMLRRDSLDVALTECERGSLPGTSCIVFGRAWWETLTGAQQSVFRKRARRARVYLRSDSLLGNHFVEVRGEGLPERLLSSEREELPHRAR